MWRGLALSALGSVTVRTPWANAAETCAAFDPVGQGHRPRPAPERPLLAAVALVGDPLGPLPLARSVRVSPVIDRSRSSGDTPGNGAVRT